MPQAIISPFLSHVFEDLGALRRRHALRLRRGIDRAHLVCLGDDDAVVHHHEAAVDVPGSLHEASATA